MQVTNTIGSDDRGFSSEILREFLTSYESAELIGLYVRAQDSFIDFGLDGIEDDLENFVMLINSGQVEPVDISEKINDRIIRGLHEILERHDIKVDPEIKIIQLVDIVEALHQLIDTELSEDVISTLDMQEDNQFTLCRLLALTGGESEEDYLNDVWDVSDTFLANVRLVHTKQLEDMARVGNFTALNLLRQEIKRYHAYIKTDNTRTHRAINAGLELGLPLKTYLDYFQDSLNLLKNANLAVEFFELALISQERKEDPVALADRHLEAIVSDTGRIQEIRRILRNLSMNYVNYCKTTPLT